MRTPLRTFCGLLCGGLALLSIIFFFIAPLLLISNRDASIIQDLAVFWTFRIFGLLVIWGLGYMSINLLRKN